MMTLAHDLSGRGDLSLAVAGCPVPETFEHRSAAPPRRARDDAPSGEAAEAIRLGVRRLLASLYPASRGLERRREQRYPFPYLIRLTPVDEQSVPSGEPLVVVGKHLSERGLGFYHPRPLAHRRMLVSLETDGGGWLSFLIDLSWCRFTRHGWYESGGRFLQSVPTPAM